MKTRAGFLLFLLWAVPLLAAAQTPFPDPGPEDAGVRLRLCVTPKAEDGKEGYDVQVDVLSTSSDALPLQVRPPLGRPETEFREALEAAISIESYPAIEPWLGQVQASPKEVRSPEYRIVGGETLTLKWHCDGRHLKNSVTNPLEVQNPEFTENGLHSIHATVVLKVGGKEVLLRSNEQMVPIGGSRQSPKHTYGQLWGSNEAKNTAMLGMGALHKVQVGDRFRIQTGTIGMTWTLTITRVEPNHSFGNLEPSQESPLPMFPRQGFYAALIPNK